MKTTSIIHAALAFTLALAVQGTIASNFKRQHRARSSLAVRKADAQCGDTSGNGDKIWGIDYRKFETHSYVRFVLADSDKGDKKDRFVIDIPNCGDWADKNVDKRDYNLTETFNAKQLWVHPELPNNEPNKFARQACQTFIMHYFPSTKAGFDKISVTTAISSKLSIGWHVNDDGYVPGFVDPIDPINMRKQQSFLLSCKDGWYQEDGGNKYYGKRCLIRMGSGTGLCLGVVDINDPRTLGKGECPDINADDISPNYLWNLQAVAEQM